MTERVDKIIQIKLKLYIIITMIIINTIVPQSQQNDCLKIKECNMSNMSIKLI